MTGWQRTYTLAWSAVLVVLVALCFVAWSYLTLPRSNSAATHFDTIIVLGTPSLLNGAPSLEQTARVSEGVREYRRGVANHIVMTGGAAHNAFVEAHTMVQLAESQGVPPGDLLEEGRAQNTIQNIFYSALLMQQHGWKSAEVVSSPNHLPRAALILEHYSFAWRTHAALWPTEFSKMHIVLAYASEASYSCKLRWIGFKQSPFLPRQGRTS